MPAPRASIAYVRYEQLASEDAETSVRDDAMATGGRLNSERTTLLVTKSGRENNAIVDELGNDGAGGKAKLTTLE